MPKGRNPGKDRDPSDHRPGQEDAMANPTIPHSLGAATPPRLAGARFGRLIAIERIWIADKRYYYWRCRCDCGNEKLVRGGNLQCGTTRSCGCLYRLSREEAESRFWSRVKKTAGCWEWQGSTNADGYGQSPLHAFPGERFAYRIAWIITNGPIPAGVEFLHSCDNRRCVRPDHLSLGTHALNMFDASMKGRLAKKLTMDDARRIRQEAGTLAEIAKRWGVCFQLISSIKRGKVWKEHPSRSRETDAPTSR